MLTYAYSEVVAVGGSMGELVELAPIDEALGSISGGRSADGQGGVVVNSMHQGRFASPVFGTVLYDAYTPLITLILATFYSEDLHRESIQT
jgi:hypothetical protein